MRIQVTVPSMLQHAVGDARHVWIEASTLSELIRSLQSRYPLLRPLVWDEQLQLRKHIMIFLNDQSLAWLPADEVTLKEGDELSIVQAVSGGIDAALVEETRPAGSLDRRVTSPARPNSLSAICYNSCVQPERFILHVDMDAFFASIEQLDHPEWRGKPLLVGGTGNRGVVSAASYEARKFGCRSAQPMAVARRLCPHAIVARGNYARYKEVSRQVMAIFNNYTPIVEPLSIDEAFLDVTLSVPLFGRAEAIAQKIRADVKRETGVTGSVGVAPNKFLAKLASDMNKPDGLTVLTPQNIGTILPPLAIEKMWGVGPKTAERLRGMGVKTFGDISRMPIELLKLKVGEDAERWQRLARGQDIREVHTERDAKSIGQEQTFGENLQDPEAVRAIIMAQCEDVAAKLRRSEVKARSVTVKIRYGDFQTITRRCTVEKATDVTIDLWQAARDLFDTWAAKEFRPVRLIGVQAGQLSGDAEQLDLFPDASKEKQQKVDGVVDQINRKFGKSIVNRKLT